MRVLSAKNLLDAWERCLDEPAPMRGATLLAVACDVEVRETARWTIAHRDSALFDLRQQLFGDKVEAVVSCVRCGEQAELDFTLAEVRKLRNASDEPSNKFSTRVIQIHGRRIRYRAPNSEDLLAISGCTEIDEARQRLLERCVGFADTKPGTLTDAMVRRVLTQLNRDHAKTTFEVNLTCPGCGFVWAAPFDIAAFLWREIDDWARRMLREVHHLASRYGWSESDILSMSARRRHQYLELLGT